MLERFSCVFSYNFAVVHGEYMLHLLKQVKLFVKAMTVRIQVTQEHSWWDFSIFTAFESVGAFFRVDLRK